MFKHLGLPFGLRLSQPRAALVGLTLATAISLLIFMTIDAKGSWDFVLPFRGRKLAGLVLVGVAIALSTVLFQTITNNRILTPSIMGFDALFRLTQTFIVFFFSSMSLSAADPKFLFFINAALMLTFSLALFRWLFGGSQRDLHLLVLAGFIFGAFFRAITELMQRLINPSEFAILQDSSFARFSAIDETLMGFAIVVIAICTVIAFSMRKRLDVMSLGRDTAINLGVNYSRTVTQVVVLVSVLVATSTALVGPVTFFGLLVANLAYQISGTTRHAITLPTACFVGVLFLVGGQIILERLLGFNSSLAIVIEFVGGIVFIALLLRKAQP